MKKLALIAITMTISTIHGYAQDKCEISNNYEGFISVQKSASKQNKYLIKQVVESESKSCFPDLVNNNTRFIDYLLKNFSSNSNDQERVKLKDSLALKEAYVERLKKDSLFNAVMTELVNKTINDKMAKDTVSIGDLLNVAVKYFSIRRINKKGYYVGKLCAGLNGIKETEIERKPFIEAFSFSSISKHYRSEEFNMYYEFKKAIKELYKVNLGINKDDKLLRAQGAMFLLMSNNTKLKAMLKTEYERQKQYLPFILINE